MEQTAESLIEPSSSITCSISLTKDRLMTKSIICKYVYKVKKVSDTEKIRVGFSFSNFGFQQVSIGGNPI
jgi:hypothetical protein